MEYAIFVYEGEGFEHGILRTIKIVTQEEKVTEFVLRKTKKGGYLLNKVEKTK